MYQPPLERDGGGSGLLASCALCLEALLRCFCCLETDSHGGERRQRLLSHGHGEAAIEASRAQGSPSRLPASSDRTALLKGHGPSTSALLPSASPPMPLPFFSPLPSARHKHKRSGSGSDPQQRDSGGNNSSGSTSPGGGSPTATGKGGKQQHKGGSALSLLEDDDVCPTCLESYTEEDPKLVTRCGHHFHLQCLYAWLERSETCPVCSNPMHFEEIL